MGQYYEQYVRDADGNEYHFNPQETLFMTAHGLTSMDGVERKWDFDDPTSYGYLFQGLKLMEHSWLPNLHVAGVMESIEDNPCAVAWVGDYANEVEDFDEVDGYSRCIYEKVWTEHKLPDSPFEAFPQAETSGLLVNHTKRIFLDLEEYSKHSKTKDGWCVHPLPILTCIGNGRGGGDYWGTNMDIVGSWAMDTIEFTKFPLLPCDYMQVDYDKYRFIEDR